METCHSPHDMTPAPARLLLRPQNIYLQPRLSQRELAVRGGPSPAKEETESAQCAPSLGISGVCLRKGPRCGSHGTAPMAQVSGGSTWLPEARPSSLAGPECGRRQGWPEQALPSGMKGLGHSGGAGQMGPGSFTVTGSGAVGEQREGPSPRRRPLAPQHHGAG